MSDISGKCRTDSGALAMKVYGHLRNQHSASMAKLVKFEPTNVIPPRRTRTK